MDIINIRRASGGAIGVTAFAMTMLLPACTQEQVELGRWYTIYLPRQGECPVLEWRFEVNPQRSITGSLGPWAGPPPATLSGTLNPDDTFQMTATSAQSTGTTRLSGRFNQQLTTLTIDGDAVGRACDKQTIPLRFVPFYGPYGAGGSG